MHSMTGFGQASGESERFRLSVTLRGVNHRFLDLALRLRDDLRPLEPALRELLSSRLHRGRVEASVEVSSLAARQVEVRIDDQAAAAVKGTCDDLAAKGLISGRLELADLLRLPEVLRLEIRDPDWTAADREALLGLAAGALDQMVAARAVEGEKIAVALAERVAGLRELTGSLLLRWQGMAEELAASLRERIAQLAGDNLDEDRLAQEVAYLVDRSDVGEELDRLQSHLEHFQSIMGADGSLGKRLDFLTQEILRELNTLGAKCRDSEMIRRVLDAKVLCEQLREQVQNIE